MMIVPFNTICHKFVVAFLRVHSDAAQNEKWTSVTHEAEKQLERLDQCID